MVRRLLTGLQHHLPHADSIIFEQKLRTNLGGYLTLHSNNLTREGSLLGKDYGTGVVRGRMDTTRTQSACDQGLFRGTFGGVLVGPRFECLCLLGIQWRLGLLCPTLGGHQTRSGVLEARHHVAREELIAAPRGLWFGPLVRHHQIAAEPTRLLLQSLNLPDRFVRCADDAETSVVDPGDAFVERRPGGSELRCSDRVLGV